MVGQRTENIRKALPQRCDAHNRCGGGVSIAHRVLSCGGADSGRGDSCCNGRIVHEDCASGIGLKAHAGEAACHQGPSRDAMCRHGS